MSDVMIIVNRHGKISMPKSLSVLNPGRSTGVPDTYSLNESIELDFFMRSQGEYRFSTISDLSDRLGLCGDIAFCLDLRDGRALVKKFSETYFPKKSVGGATHILLLGSFVQEIQNSKLLVPCLCIGAHANASINYIAHNAPWKKGYAVAYFNKEFSAFSASGRHH